MSRSIFSASWYRVANLKPRLRSHAQIHRHQYRGETWHVLQELTMERFYRFSPAAYSVIGLMDGRSSVDEIWKTACTRLGDDAPTQDEMIDLLSKLYQADVLQCDVTPDAAELVQRRDEQVRRRWQSRIFSIFSWRFPLIDPERILNFFLPFAKPLFGWFGGVLWLATVIPALILLGAHWTDLTEGVLDRVLVPGNLMVLWVLFPIIKIFHEFGHAFAARVYGGEVHDMGIMLLVIAPVPYVDASSASAFREKWKRVVVGAAGMLVELFIAALALFLWLNAEPGLVRTLAYNAIFIASVSTVLFNANPLLRYDGYYILADLIEIPNLRSRANAYLFHLCERYLFGNVQAEPPHATRSERAWFVFFGILSSVYRIFVVVAILFYVADKLFNLGAILALAAAAVWLVFPLLKGGYFLFTSPRLRRVRVRAITVTAVVLLLAVSFITLVPVPYRTGTEGVIWIPEESFVRAGAEGFVERVVAVPDSRVEAGAPLISLSNPNLMTQEKVVLSRLQELEARHTQFLISDPVKAEMTQSELKQTQDTLTRIREEIRDLTVRSQIAGKFVVPVPEDLPARFVRKGELLGYVLEADRITVRTIVSQSMIDMVRSRTERVEVRLSERINMTVPAVIKRIVPGASEQLPARALGTVGGGGVATDPTDREGLKTFQRMFQMDLELPTESNFINLGGRSYVRFDHGWAPLAVQWYFEIRQIFLSRFNV